MIKTDKLTKVYSSGTKALDNLSVHVEEGEIFGFLGPNGAGKSTAIKILTTLSRPTSGWARIGGYNVLTEPDKVRGSIGYVAQEAGVDYFLSGRENLVLQGRLYRMDRKAISRRVEELLELFELKDSADTLVSAYSGGMRRKLDIATALIHNPKILFLDEPTLGLDPHSRSSLWNYIRMLNKDLKVTLFLTTHYLDEADKLSNRIGILHKGGLKIVDTPEALKDSIKGDSVNLSLSSGEKEKTISILKGNSIVKELLCEDGHVRVYVNNGSEAIPGLMKLLNQHGIEILSLTISRPSLDDVYLKYSGVSFKEGESSEGSNPWWAQWQKGGWGKKWKGEGDWDKEGEEGVKEWSGGDQEWEKWAEGDNKGSNNEWKGLGQEESKDSNKKNIEDNVELKTSDNKPGEDAGWQKWSQGDNGNMEWGRWSQGNVEGGSKETTDNTGEKKKEESWDKDKNQNQEEASKKWGSNSDWEKWGKGGKG